MPAALGPISYYLPPDVLTNAMLSTEFPEWSVEKIAEKTGIVERHVTDEKTCSSDLAVEAAGRLFAEHNVAPSDIDYLLLCTQSPDYFLPTTACLVQHRLGIPTRAGALDYNLGCSGYVYGLGLASGLIETKQARNVLLITAETYSKFVSRKDKSVRTIFGDAAAATLIQDSVEGSIGPFVFGTDGAGAKNLIVRTGGFRCPGKLPGAETTDEFGNVTDPNSLHMNGPEILNFTLRVVPATINELLRKSNRSAEEIDFYVFHQANKYLLDALRKRMKIPQEKYAEWYTHCGNTVSATIPIALCHALKEGRVKRGQRVMLVGFGVGYSWGACLVTL